MTDNWNNRQKIIDIKNNKKDSLIEKIDERNDSHIVQKKSIINTKPERKNDSFLDLLERMKALNSRKERQFEPHHRSPLTKTMMDNWHNRQMDSLVSTDKLMNMTCRKTLY